MDAKQTVVTIVVRNVGTNFGCEADVRRGAEVLHTTHLVPHGFAETARQFARDWADSHGFRVITTSKAQGGVALGESWAVEQDWKVK